MNIKKLFQDDDAVSPVIGVILMVAITVILAAVIASFVLGLGDSQDDVQPNTSFNFDYEEGAGSSNQDFLTITLTDGDAIVAEEMHIRGDMNGDVDVDLTWTGTSGDIDTGSSSGTGGFTAGTSGNEMSPGQGVELVSGTNTAGAWSDYEISLVWETSENSATLEDSEGPDA